MALNWKLPKNVGSRQTRDEYNHSFTHTEPNNILITTSVIHMIKLILSTKEMLQVKLHARSII